MENYRNMDIPVFGRRPDEEERQRIRMAIEAGEIKLPKFADLMMDYWFKRAFGNEKWKRMLLLLLREILPEHDIQSIEYTQTEHVNPFAEKADIRIDVECVSGDGSRFIVEVQRANDMYFGNRLLYYSSFAILQQLGKGHRSFDYRPVYVIALMNFIYHKDSPAGHENKFMYKYMLVDVDNPGEYLTDRMKIIMLELPKVTKEQARNRTKLELFCYYLHNMTNLDDIPEKDDDEMFAMLHNSAKTVNFTPDEILNYAYDMTTQQDILNQIEYSRLEGREEGLAEGEKKGREEGLAEGKLKGLEEGRLEIAKLMKAKGMSIADIMDITGLVADTLSRL
ncbi:MAG: Rpn family recombination-promoting nuclease/putative transposase [Bacteroidales bacterium]|nr:Rpn family recombination-promoting nuclease/putative transposase [Bacteroidales bacterium]